MELLWVIIGIGLVWKFSSVMTALAMAGRVKAEVMCEEVIIEATVERSELVGEFIEATKEKTIYSHDDVLKMMKIKK